jgi:hypothetical protein
MKSRVEIKVNNRLELEVKPPQCRRALKVKFDRIDAQRVANALLHFSGVNRSLHPNAREERFSAEDRSQELRFNSEASGLAARMVDSLPALLRKDAS